MNKGYRYNTKDQSCHIDLLPKSEIFDSAAIYCDAEGVTFVGGGVCSPRKFWKIEGAKVCFPLF